MAEGVNTGPSFVAPLAEDSSEGVNTAPTFIAPLTEDSTEGVAAIPTFVSPGTLDDASAADTPSVVEPQDFAASADGSGAIAPLSLHDSGFLPRSDTGFSPPIPIDAAQGSRVEGNLFFTIPSKGYADTAAYTIALVMPTSVKARLPAIEGATTPRARVRGMRGSPY